LRESEFRIVTCDPRETVSVWGQIVLFWMTSVLALVLGVQPVVGPVVPDDESLPHAASASPQATTAPNVHILSFCMNPSCGELVNPRT
jgi:hypothetical protein